MSVVTLLLAHVSDKYCRDLDCVILGPRGWWRHERRMSRIRVGTVHHPRITPFLFARAPTVL